MSSIRKRYNDKSKKYVYQVVIEVGKDKDGKRAREYRTFDNKKDADIFAKEMDVQISRDSFVKKNKMSVAEVGSYWLKYLEQKETRYNTLRGYAVNVNNHIIPSIGEINIQKLTSLHINDMIKDLKNKGLGTTSIRYVLRNLNSMIEFSIKRQWLYKSPMDEVNIPKPEPYKSEPYSKDELRKLIKVSKGTELEYILKLEAFTGIRIGELVALKWSDVDFEKKTISISKTIVYQTGIGCVSSPPKSFRSNRTLPLTDFLVNELKRLKNDEIIKLKNYKKGSRINGMNIFHNKKWLPRSPSSVTTSFSLFLKNNNLRHIRFHDLRHTFLSTLYLECDVDATTLRDIAGHSRTSTTLNTYVGSTSVQQIVGLNKLNTLLN